MRWIPRIIGLLLLGIATFIASRAPESAAALAGRRTACLDAIHAERAEQAAMAEPRPDTAPALAEQEGRAAQPLARRIASDEVCEQMPPLWDEDLAMAALSTAAAGLVLLAVGLAMRRPLPSRRPAARA